MFRLVYEWCVPLGKIDQFQDVWREANRMTSLDNVIDVQMGRLRRKIDFEFGQRLIHTIRGVGFILKEEQYS